jgi:hypothetical protein
VDDRSPFAKTVADLEALWEAADGNAGAQSTRGRTSGTRNARIGDDDGGRTRR